MLKNAKTNEISHVGKVLQITSRYMGMEHEVDFALVQELDGSFKEVQVGGGNSYGTGQEWKAFYADADATEEVKKAYAEYLQKIEAARYAAQKEVEWEKRKVEQAQKANEPTPGKMVQVVKGNKVKKGVCGKVFWIGFGRTCKRVGFVTDAGEKLFVDLDRVVIVA